MKKYVKPMMESEAFVANEFVSACWTLSCVGGCGGVERVHDPNNNKYDGTSFIDYDTFAGKAPCTNKLDTSTMTIDSWWDFFLLALRAIGTGMGWNQFWDIVENGETITTKTPIHQINVTKGFTHPVSNMYHPNASI